MFQTIFELHDAICILNGTFSRHASSASHSSTDLILVRAAAKLIGQSIKTCDNSDPRPFLVAASPGLSIESGAAWFGEAKAGAKIQEINRCGDIREIVHINKDQMMQSVELGRHLEDPLESGGGLCMKQAERDGEKPPLKKTSFLNELYPLPLSGDKE